MMLTQRRSTFCCILTFFLHNLYLLVFVEIVAVLTIRISYMWVWLRCSSKDIPGIPVLVEDADPMQWLFIRLAWNRPQSGSLGAWSFTRDRGPIVSVHSHKHKAQIHTQTQTQRHKDAETNTETLRHRQKHSDMKTRKKNTNTITWRDTETVWLIQRHILTTLSKRLRENVCASSVCWVAHKAYTALRTLGSLGSGGFPGLESPRLGMRLS